AIALTLGKSAAAADHLNWALSRWLDVLVHAEEVRRIVLLLDRSKASVIIAERSLNPLLAFVHHEVDVGASCRIGMQRIIIVLAPLCNFPSVSRVGVYTDNDLGEQGFPEAVGCIVLTYALRRAVDRVKVHSRKHSRQLRTVFDVLRNGRIAQPCEVVGPPVPLQPRNKQTIKGALHCWKWRRADRIE